MKHSDQALREVRRPRQQEWLRSLLVATGIVGLVVAVGCNSEDRQGATVPKAARGDPTKPLSQAFSAKAEASLKPSTPKHGGTYSINYGLIKSLHNIFRRDYRSGTVCREYVFPTLLAIDPNTLEIVPELAVSRPEILDDGKRLRFRLRTGIYWHRLQEFDPKIEVTTADVEHSWNIIQTEENALHVKGMLGAFAEIQTIDSHTFDAVLAKPHYRAELDFGTEFRLMPAHLADVDPAELGRNPVGYGPYRFEDWQENQAITLVFNPEYPSRPGHEYYFDRLRFLMIRDTSTVPALFLAKNLRTATIDDPARWDQMKEEAAYQEAATFHEYLTFRFNYIAWNHRHWALADPKVRRALTHLFPREVVRDEFYRGHAELVSGPWPLLTNEYNHAVKPLEFDPETAKTLLYAAGFEDTDGDGFLDKGGKRFEFDLFHETTKVPAMERGALLFQQELQNVGVKLNLRPMDLRTIFDNLGEGTFEAAQLGWGNDPRDEDLFLLLHSSSGDAYNHMGYSSPQCDALLEEYRSEMDQDRRRTIAYQIHERVCLDQPVLFLPTPKTLLLISSDLGNVKISRRGATFRGWYFLDS